MATKISDISVSLTRINATLDRMEADNERARARLSEQMAIVAAYRNELDRAADIERTNAKLQQRQGTNGEGK